MSRVPFSIPWDWENAFSVLLNLAEVWSRRPIVRPTSNEIAADEGLANRHRSLTISALGPLKRAKIVEFTRKRPMGWRLARTPSRISALDVCAAMSQRKTDEMFSHLAMRTPLADLRRTRSHRGHADPQAWLFDSLNQTVVEKLRTTSLAKILAANLGLEPLILYRNDYVKSRYTVSLADSTRPVMLEFAPLIEVMNGALVVWAYHDVVKSLRGCFRPWHDALPEKAYDSPTRIRPEDLFELYEWVTSGVAVAPEPGEIAMFRKWERLWATEVCHQSPGSIAVVETTPWRKHPAFEVLCTNREKLIEFARKVGRDDAVGEICEDGLGEPVPMTKVATLRSDGCWSFTDRRKRAETVYRRLAGTL